MRSCSRFYFFSLWYRVNVLGGGTPCGYGFMGKYLFVFGNGCRGIFFLFCFCNVNRLHSGSFEKMSKFVIN